MLGGATRTSRKQETSVTCYILVVEYVLLSHKPYSSHFDSSEATTAHMYVLSSYCSTGNNSTDVAHTRTTMTLIGQTDCQREGNMDHIFLCIPHTKTIMTLIGQTDCQRVPLYTSGRENILVISRLI